MSRHSRITRWVTILWTLGTILILTQPAQAHIIAGESGGFLSGLKHPWSGWDHICAMVAVGLWGAQLGMPAIWVLPVTFPVIMAFGGFLGLIGMRFPGDEIGIAASAILLGIMVLLAARPPLVVAMILVGIFGLFHGYAHGHELPPGQSGLLYSIGFVVATGTLHAVGITIGILHRWKPGRFVIRAAGGAITAAGFIFLAQAIHPEVSENSKAAANPSFAVAANRFVKNRIMRSRQFLFASAAILLIQASAQAHLVTTGLGPVYDGIGHFSLSPDDSIPVVALGLLAGLRGKSAGRGVMFQLPLAWFCGGVAGLMAHLAPSMPLQCFSFLAIGILVAADLRLPVLAVTAMALVIGFMHGFLNGFGFQPAGPGKGVLELLGIAAIIFVLATIVSAMVVSIRPAWARIVVRVAGSWVAAIGLLMLGWALRPGQP